MKKVFFFVLAMGLVLLMLVACNNGNNGGSGAVTPPQNDEPVTETTTPEPTPTPPDIPQEETSSLDDEDENDDDTQTTIPSPATFSGIGNTPGNIVNGGLVAYNNGRIYFGNPSEHSYLQSMNVDGSDLRTHFGTPVANMHNTSINIVGNQIFYLSDFLTILSTDDWRFSRPAPEVVSGRGLVPSTIYVIDDTIILRMFASVGGRTAHVIISSSIDGSNQHILSDDDDTRNLVVADNRIYFTVGGTYHDERMYSMNIDGSDRREIPRGNSRAISYINISNGRIIYIGREDVEGIYSKNIDGSDWRQLTETSNRVSALNVDGDIVYFGVGSRIYSMNIDGTNRQQLVSDMRAEAIFVAGGCVFIRRIRNRNNYLYRMNPDGSDLREVERNPNY